MSDFNNDEKDLTGQNPAGNSQASQPEQPAAQTSQSSQQPQQSDSISSSQPYVSSYQPAASNTSIQPQNEQPQASSTSSTSSPIYTYSSSAQSAPQPSVNPPQAAQQPYSSQQFAAANQNQAYQQQQAPQAAQYQWSSNAYHSGQYSHQQPQHQYSQTRTKSRTGPVLIIIIAVLAVLLVVSIGWIIAANVGGPSTPDSNNNVIQSTQATQQNNNGSNNNSQPTTSLQQGNASLGSSQPAATTVSPDTGLSAYSQTVANAIAKNENSVVGIDCTGGSGWNAFESQGTGFIVRSDGYIATNEHVIDGADKITVYLSNGKSYDATLVGSDIVDDLAVLKINETGLSIVEYGDSSTLVMGELAIAIGCPSGLDLQGTSTAGIISYPARTLQITAGKTVTVIQTSAQINEGNSGGPLINDRGQVVGINSMKLASGYEGIGFSIPIDSAIPIIEQLINTGTVSGGSSSYVQAKGYLGVSGEDVTQNGTQPEGFLIDAIQSGSPAETVGIQVGDIITGIDGVTVTSYNDLKAELDKHLSGDTVTIQLWRNGRTLTVKPTLYYYDTSSQSPTG